MGKCDAEAACSKYQDVTKWLTTGGRFGSFGSFGVSAVISRLFQGDNRREARCGDARPSCRALWARHRRRSARAKDGGPQCRLAVPRDQVREIASAAWGTPRALAEALGDPA